MTRANSEDLQLEGEQIKRNRSDEGADVEDEEEEEGDEDGDHGDGDVNSSSRGDGSKEEQPYVEQQQPGSNDSGPSSKPKRNPFCSRCRNHGKRAQVKGHKRHCEYRDCQCDGCKLVECRQFVSALQIKRRRYQKQDEECGRRIEISPPVLKSEPSTDPAAMIAKTLIGPKAQQQHQPLSLHHTAPPTGPKRHVDLSTEQLNHRQLFCSIPMQPVTTTTAASAVTNSAISCHHHHQHQQTAANTALSNALHLFQLPNPMLSPHNHYHHHHQQLQQQHQHQHQGSQLPASQQQQHHQQHHQLPQQSTSPSLPSPSEQLNLVEEILHSFGPMAIYAWLRAEHFDLQKIHNSIELVRPYYNNLVNLKLNYAHQAAAAAAAASAATKGTDLTETSQHHCTITAVRGSSSPTTRTFEPADTSGSNSNCSSGGGGGTAGSCVSGVNKIYEGGGAPTGPTPMSLSTGAQTITNTTSSSTIMPNTSIDTSAGTGSTTSAPSSAHLSLAATLNSLPIPTASGLLWSGLRSAASVIDRDSSSVIRPLPFLPHFMHQHHHNLFNGTAHHHHHQSNYNQHPHQLVSPSSAVTNLSTLTSSSSTVL